MYQFDLGWTADDGCNLFAIGWLSRIVATLDSGSGLDGFSVKIGRLRKKQTQRNIKNLLFMTLLFMAAQEENYGPPGRQEDETDTPD